MDLEIPSPVCGGIDEGEHDPGPTFPSTPTQPLQAQKPSQNTPAKRSHSPTPLAWASGSRSEFSFDAGNRHTLPSPDSFSAKKIKTGHQNTIKQAFKTFKDFLKDNSIHAIRSFIGKTRIDAVIDTLTLKSSNPAQPVQNSKIESMLNSLMERMDKMES